MSRYQGVTTLEYEPEPPNLARQTLTSLLLGLFIVFLLLGFTGRLPVNGLPIKGFGHNISPFAKTTKHAATKKNPVKKAPPVVDPGKVSAKTLANYGYVQLNPSWHKKVVAGEIAKIRSHAPLYLGMIEAAGKKWNVDPRLIAAVVRHESGFNTINAISRSRDGRPMTISFSDNGSRGHAIGLGQLLKRTAQDYGVDPYDNAQNLMGEAHLLRHLLDKYNNNVSFVLAAYNSGKHSVAICGFCYEQGNPKYHIVVERNFRKYGGTVH